MEAPRVATVAAVEAPRDTAMAAVEEAPRAAVVAPPSPVVPVEGLVRPMGMARGTHVGLTKCYHQNLTGSEVGRD